jgi:hypothetical protein
MSSLSVFDHGGGLSCHVEEQVRQPPTRYGDRQRAPQRIGRRGLRHDIRMPGPAKAGRQATVATQWALGATRERRSPRQGVCALLSAQRTEAYRMHINRARRDVNNRSSCMHLGAGETEGAFGRLDPSQRLASTQ